MYLPACRLQVYHYRRRRNCQYERLGCPKQHEGSSNKTQGTSHLQDPIQATTYYTLSYYIDEGAERVDSLRVLGVQFDSKLSMGDHIIKLLTTCSSSTYALRVLRSHGLKPNELHLVDRATTVGSILHAAPAWYGFANEGD